MIDARNISQERGLDREVDQIDAGTSRRSRRTPLGETAVSTGEREGSATRPEDREPEQFARVPRHVRLPWSAARARAAGDTADEMGADPIVCSVVGQEEVLLVSILQARECPGQAQHDGLDATRPAGLEPRVERDAKTCARAARRGSPGARRRADEQATTRGHPPPGRVTVDSQIREAGAPSKRETLSARGRLSSSSPTS